MNKLALIIGHSEQSQGAVNEASGVTEWEFNSRLAPSIHAKLVIGLDSYAPNIRSQIFHRTAGIPDLVNRINEWNPDLAIEFHCNAFDKKASGTEMLIADCHKPSPIDGFYEYVSGLCFNVAQSIHPLFPDRTNKLVSSQKNISGKYKERGAYFLWETKCKAIIAESFFIDNDLDFQKANNNRPALIQAYVDWIKNYFREG
jgi:N-acetylmuramoyl-L-alanine amidase